MSYERKIIKSFKCYNAECKLEFITEKSIRPYRVTLKTDMKTLDFSIDYKNYVIADGLFQKMLKYWMF